MPRIYSDSAILTESAHEIRTASFWQNIANTAQLIRKAWVEKQNRDFARTKSPSTVVSHLSVVSLSVGTVGYNLQIPGTDYQ